MCQTSLFYLICKYNFIGQLRKAKVVKKSNGSLLHARTNVGNSTKVSEENRVMDQVLPGVPVSGNCFLKKKYTFTLSIPFQNAHSLELHFCLIFQF